MIRLAPDIEALALRLAVAQHLPVDEAIRRALNREAQSTGLAAAARRRMSAEQMLAFGGEVAALPVLDRRAPNQIMDDLDSL